MFFSSYAYGVERFFPKETKTYKDVLNTGKIIVIGSSPTNMNQNEALRLAKIDAEEKAYLMLNDLPMSGTRTLEDLALFDSNVENFMNELRKDFTSCRGKGAYDRAKKQGYFCVEGNISPLYTYVKSGSKVPDYKYEKDAEASFDSVIINVNRFFIPALMNKIVSADGKEIWNRTTSKPDYALSVSDAVSMLLSEGRERSLSLPAESIVSYTDIYLDKSSASQLLTLLSTGADVKIVFAYIQ